MVPYTTADQLFDAEMMGNWACPRHGASCDCCYECGLGNGHHEKDCPLGEDAIPVEIEAGFGTEPTVIDKAPELRTRS